MTSTTYHVTGMTCEHCARAVAAELSALGGVTEVTVDLVPGGASEVTVVSGERLDVAAIEAALDEAGDYQLTPLGRGPEGEGPEEEGPEEEGPEGEGPAPASRGAASPSRELPIVERP